MTVCVATICELGAKAGARIIGASDRMLGYGEETYQPPMTKIVPFLPAAAIMYAGTAQLHAEIINAVIQAAAAADAVGNGPSGVDDMVRLYANCYAAARERRAEQQILRPLGLDLASFRARARTPSRHRARANRTASRLSIADRL
jgi:hypothetical protein